MDLWPRIVFEVFVFEVFGNLLTLTITTPAREQIPSEAPNLLRYSQYRNQKEFFPVNVEKLPNTIINSEPNWIRASQTPCPKEALKVVDVYCNGKHTSLYPLVAAQNLLQALKERLLNEIL